MSIVFFSESKGKPHADARAKRGAGQVVILNGVCPSALLRAGSVKNPGILRCAQNDTMGLA